jgi:hypothetical protein
MQALRDRPRAAGLPLASEAAFTVRERLTALDARVERLRAALAGEATSRAAASFLATELEPRFLRVCALVEDAAATLAVELDRSVEPSARTLSPGDLGFHNALQRRDGTLVFIDFEYGGWDDAAQVLAQSCLAPQVPVPAALRSQLLNELGRRLAASRETVARLRLLYPLLALKWGLIVLNEFLPVGAERRSFAGARNALTEEERLARARALLREAEEAARPSSFLADLVAAAPASPSRQEGGS